MTENQQKDPSRLRRCLLYALLGISLLSLFLLSVSQDFSIARAGQSVNIEPATNGLPNGFANPFADEPSNPFISVIPDLAGRELYISIQGLGDDVGIVYVNSIIGPTGRQYSYSAAHPDPQANHYATVTGLTPGVDVVVTINLTSTTGNLTSTTGLQTPPQEYLRAYVPAATTRAISAGNSRLELTIVNTDTFANETYIVFVPGLATNHNIPAAHRMVGQPFAINASGSVTTTTRSMLLKFRYNVADLGGAPPDTLALMQWQPDTQEWVPLTANLDTVRSEISTTIRRFTTYALMVTPVTDKDFWNDDFNDLSTVEIPSLQNVDLKLKAGFAELLALTNGKMTGVAISKAIAPAAIQQWGRLSYSALNQSAMVTLTIDLLDQNGNLLLADLPDGASLSMIDPVAHPVLRLRARFMSSVPGESVWLDQWQVSWQLPALEPTETATPTATLTALPTDASTVVATNTPVSLPLATPTPVTPTPAIPTPVITVEPVATLSITNTYTIYLPEITR